MSDRPLLTDAERLAIRREAAHYPDPRAAAVDSLKLVQDRTGWISDEVLAEVAAELGLTTAELDAIATFYTLIFRRPVGEHVILVCDSVSCWITGCDRIVDRLGELLGIGLGETSEDGLFTLLPIPCLGACDRAPALMIDDDLHGDVIPDDLPGLLERYRHGDGQ